LGLNSGKVAKFVRQFADLRTETINGLSAYADAVRSREFPAAEHTYAMPPEELDALRAKLALDQRTAPPRLDSGQRISN